jgi:hypothetical protein
VGTPVFGGMILASFIGIFAIPPLYVFFQAIRERLRPSTRPPDIPPRAPGLEHSAHDVSGPRPAEWNDRALNFAPVPAMGL